MGSLQTWPPTGLKCRAQSAQQNFRAFTVEGRILLGGVFALGGFLTGGLWFVGFCLEVFWGAFDRIHTNKIKSDLVESNSGFLEGTI